MIAVLCIMAILVTLCLSVLLASSVLINSAQGKALSEQCRLSAVTMSKELQKNLEDDKGGLAQYINANIDIKGPNVNWPYYNPYEGGHSESFPVYRTLTTNTNTADTAGAVSVRMYWEWDMGGDIEYLFLHVDVTAEKRGQKHTVTSFYGLSIDEKGNHHWQLDQRS